MNRLQKQLISALREKQITHVEAANLSGVSLATIQNIVYGRKVSEPISKKVLEWIKK